MRMIVILLLLVVFLASSSSSSSLPASSSATCCQLGDATCWPTDADLQALQASFTALSNQTSSSRSIAWKRGQAYIDAVPISSFNDQPLYGAGKSLDALYVQSEEDRKGRCFVNDFTPNFCLISTRNNPMHDWEPALVAWPASAAEVQILVSFANEHSLCVSVAGTGHDFMNRHSRDQSLFIKTTLLKDIEWDADDKRGLNKDGGSVRLGAGVVFSQAHESASKVNRAISSGWSPTVGIAGWSMGGGHGPFANSYGLGVDNLLEVEIVLADGSLATANANGVTKTLLNGSVVTSDQSDLFWAIRGGGGSAFGIVISYTVRGHFIPAGGYTKGDLKASGTFCDDGSVAALGAYFEAFSAWSLQLNKKWSGLVFFTPAFNSTALEDDCAYSWTLLYSYLYQGPSSDNDFNKDWSYIVSSVTTLAGKDNIQPSITSLSNSFEVNRYNLEYIIPITWLPQIPNYYAGGIPSVLITRDAVSSGAFSTQLMKTITDCIASQLCPQSQIYQDITGNTDSPQVSQEFVSISDGMRSSIFHVVLSVFPTSDPQGWYQLGANSYFSESAYDMEGWQERLWGANIYSKLLAVKKEVDPHGFFWCRHCVGDESE